MYGKERTIILTFNQNLYDDQLTTLINDLERCQEKLSLLSLRLKERAGGHYGQTLFRMDDPILRGWINYYGKFYKSQLYCIFLHLNRILGRWAMRKYKRLRGHSRKAIYWLGNIAIREPSLFCHLQWDLKPSAEQ